jgi:hypothetical protein
VSSNQRGLSSQSSDGQILALSFNHPDKKRLFHLSQHGHWNLHSVKKSSKPSFGFDYNFESEGYVSIFQGADGRFQKQGALINKKGSSDPAYGRVFLESKEQSEVHGIKISKGLAYVSYMRNPQRTLLGEYIQIGDLMVQGQYGSQGMWIVYNPNYMNQNTLINTNSWLSLESSLYTQQESLFGSQSSSLDRYFRSALYMLSV